MHKTFLTYLRPVALAPAHSKNMWKETKIAPVKVQTELQAPRSLKLAYGNTFLETTGNLLQRSTYSLNI